MAPNATLAKVASDLNKPNGQALVGSSREAVMAFVQALPIRKVSAARNMFNVRCCMCMRCWCWWWCMWAVRFCVCWQYLCWGVEYLPPVSMPYINTPSTQCLVTHATFSVSFD